MSAGPAPEPEFWVLDAVAVPHSAAPTLSFRMRVRESSERPVYTIALTAQIQLEASERPHDAATKARLLDVFGEPERWGDTVKRLVRISSISLADAPPRSSIQLLIRGEVAALPLEGVIDLDAERARLAKEIQKIDVDVGKIDAKLGNADFIRGAPEEVVEEQRERRDEAIGRKAKMEEALGRLRDAG